jgi:hypothetical protein
VQAIALFAYAVVLNGSAHRHQLRAELEARVASFPLPNSISQRTDDRRDDMLYELSVRFREMHNAWVAELERCGHALFQSSALLPERYDPYPCHVGQRGAPAKRKSFLQNVVAGVDATAEPFVQGVMQMAGGLQVSYNAQHALPIADYPAIAKRSVDEMFAPDDQLPYWLGVLTPSAVGGTRAIATSLSGRIVRLPATSIRLSQTSVNEAAQLTSSMKTNGWLGAPIDAVRMPYGLITAVDNTRVVAAQHAGIAVKVSVHVFDESLPPDVVARFTTRKGGVQPYAGETDSPSTGSTAAAEVADGRSARMPLRAASQCGRRLACVASERTTCQAWGLPSSHPFHDQVARSIATARTGAPSAPANRSGRHEMNGSKSIASKLRRFSPITPSTAAIR